VRVSSSSRPRMVWLADSPTEGVEFELSDDFVSGLQVIRKHQPVQRWLPQRSADSRSSVSRRLRAGDSPIAPTSLNYVEFGRRRLEELVDVAALRCKGILAVADEK